MDEKETKMEQNGVKVSGFVPDPMDGTQTLTTPEGFASFVIGDDALIYRASSLIGRAKVVDMITRASTGARQLVLAGVNRRTVKTGDFLESLRNSPSRYKTDTPAEVVLEG